VATITRQTQAPRAICWERESPVALRDPFYSLSQQMARITTTNQGEINQENPHH
jgi:hypothetical protein